MLAELGSKLVDGFAGLANLLHLLVGDFGNDLLLDGIDGGSVIQGFAGNLIPAEISGIGDFELAGFVFLGSTEVVADQGEKIFSTDLKEALFLGVGRFI